jgi:hypothetical protein
MREHACMEATMPDPIHTEPAEGARDDDAAQTATGPQPGQSAEDPAEGRDDDAPGADHGSGGE